MKHSAKHLWGKLTALFLAAAFFLAPAAQALTADQLKTLLQQYYIDEVPEQVLNCNTVEEILKALNDPYTVYMTKDEFEVFKASMEDSAVVGIGISAATTEDGLLVMGVYDNSPAKQLGLAAGDIITKVEDHLAAGETAETITSWLKGEEGTEVTFTVRHADGAEECYTAVRAKVTIPATTATLLDDGTTGYLYCSAFGSETQEHFAQGTMAYDDANMWIVDLRSNGGGDVYAVTQTLGTFLGTGTMVYLRDGSDTYYRYTSKQESTVLGPVIVLTSGNTASAAEIFAMAIKAQNGGLVIGSDTYGKGVAQVVLSGTECPDELSQGDAVKITAYQYYDTNGTTANRIGVIPDLLVNAGDADEIALLLSADDPGDDNAAWVRLHMGGWRWCINLKTAAAAENAPYLTELLEALPPNSKLYRGLGEGEWTQTTAAETAAAAGLTSYTPRGFSDLTDSGQADAVNTLCTYGMVQGYGDGTFRPDGTMTRAELCALLVQAMHLTQGKESDTFQDVPEKAWYAPYIQAVCAAGYMEGVGSGTFNPGGAVTQEQMMTVLGRIAADLNLYYRQAASAVPEQTGVPETYSNWAQKWVWLLSMSQRNLLGQTLNMLYDTPENISPHTNATRGETAEVLYNILVSISALPV